MGQKRDVNIRFDEKVERLPGDNACWEWRGAFNQRAYGKFKVRSYVMVAAHRFSYERAYGPITDNLHVLHRCDNPRCVRPDHLFLGTHLDNVRDMMRKGRDKGGIGGPEWLPKELRPRPTTATRRYGGPGKKNVCAKGHPLTDDNVHVQYCKSRDRFQRSCKTCNHERYQTKYRGRYTGLAAENHRLRQEVESLKQQLREASMVALGCSERQQYTA